MLLQLQVVVGGKDKCIQQKIFQVKMNIHFSVQSRVQSFITSKDSFGIYLNIEVVVIVVAVAAAVVVVECTVGSCSSVVVVAVKVVVRGVVMVMSYS